MRQIRINLFVITTILIAVGVVMVYSASGVYAFERHHDSLYYLKRHLIFCALGIGLAVFMMSFDYNILKRYSKYILGVSIFLLVLVMVPGVASTISGAKRWFKFSFFSFQPSELAKFTLLIYLADILARKKDYIKNFIHGFVPCAIALGATVGLVLIEPDLGRAVSIGLASIIMFFTAGIRLTHIAMIFLGSIPALYMLIFHVEYRRRRILAFLNPWLDPKGVGFQILQSYIAIGSGGLLGVGLGCSRQKLFFLPASHTDFIFSIIGEELGLVGAASILILFLLFAWNGIRVALSSKDLFAQNLSLGIVSLITIEALINMAVCAGVMPTKGLPLPFISYGGSALIFNIGAVGLLLNIAREKERYAGQ